MRIWLLGLGLGLSSSSIAQLPIADSWAMGWLSCVGLLLLIVAARSPAIVGSSASLVSGLLIGYVWSVCSMLGLLDARLPACVQDHELRLLVEVLEDPGPLHGPIANSIRLYVEVLEQRPGSCADLRGRRLRLSWYGASAVAKDQRWWVDARLKIPWGLRNPGGFDYARWMLGQRLQGSGYVRDGWLSETPVLSIAQRLRRTLRLELAGLDAQGGGIIYALTTGDAALIAPETWDALRGTGTVHLMVVSGLHVGLVAGIGYALGATLIRALPVLLLWLPANRAGTVVSIVISGGYVSLTGGGVPGQRAWSMVALFMLSRLLGRRVQAFSLLLLVFVGTLLADPANVHQQGFWLSFAAVASLFVYFRGRLQTRGRLRPFVQALLQAQWALAAGLTPWLALLTGNIPLLGPLANVVAVPVMSFAVLPASLISALLFSLWPTVGQLGFAATNWVITAMLDLLGVLSGHLALLVDPGFVPALGAIMAGFGLLWGFPGRALAVMLLLWLGWFCGQYPRVPRGEFRVMALDVGQGSAIVVDTHAHRLLFDTGPGFPSGFNLAATAVTPSVVATGPAQLDALVLSHADLDHTGGAEGVLASLPVARKYGSRGLPGVEYCSPGLTWLWDGVRFEFFNPHSLDAGIPDNDRSCVLRVANAMRSALLAGDISVKVESELGRALQPVDLMFAPHHGSRSSSSKAFVRLLNAQTVFVSAGYANRFGHPHPAVLRRYAEIGARVYVTGLNGALIWRSHNPMIVETLRDAGSRPYWAFPGRAVNVRR